MAINVGTYTRPNKKSPKHATTQKVSKYVNTFSKTDACSVSNANTYTYTPLATTYIQKQYTTNNNSRHDGQTLALS